MAIKVTRYLPPGSYITEEVVKPIPAFVGLPRQICIVGEGDHCKKVFDEDHTRAYVDAESVTPDSNGQFTLEKQTDLKASTMTLFKNGDQQANDQFTIEELIPDAPVASFNAIDPGLLDAGTHSYVVTFVVNGSDETVASNPSNVITAIGSLNSADVALPIGPTGTTARKVYRTTAGNVTPYKLAKTVSNNTAITTNDPKADSALAVTEPPADSNVTLVSIEADGFDDTATYTFSYQSLANLYDSDVLLQEVTTDCGQILFVGSFRGTKNFVQFLDYELDVATNSIKWLPETSAEITGAEVETFDLSAQPYTLKLTIDGGTEQAVVFSNVDGEDFLVAAAALAAEVATKIQTELAGIVTAAGVGGQVVITTVSTGPNSSITIGNGTANSALGFTNGSLAEGAGKNPAQGEEFFITYKSVRPESEFNRPILSTSFDQFIARIGDIASDNALALGGQIVFEQNPPFVYHIQVKNTGTGAAAQDLDYKEAIKGAELNPDLTDIVVLGHPTTNAGGKKPLIRAALREHVISMSSLQNKAERMGWFGMPINTVRGDGETPGTFVYVATQELQVSADSPGRGRFVLTAPSFVKKTFRFADGSVKQLTLDGTYISAGCAALMASFLSPAEGLLRKEVVGFDEVEQLTIGDRDFLAQNGVNIIQARAGSNVVFDPTATDQSSAEFKELNVMAQKDNIVKRVRKSTDDTLIGIVPDDLAQFIFELKAVVALQLTSAVAEGAIASFQNDDGTIRNIDLQNDIIVKRRQNDPTAYDFRFSFFVKFIVKRLFGTFSVVIPSGV
jgi:hypothetical protein